MAKSKNSVTEYRNYYLPLHFPVLLLSGDYWKISDIPSGRLHFHNCLEIGVCHSDSGIIELYGEPFPFREGDITIIPKNVPHTTYSSSGTASHWSYLMIDPQELFRSLLPNTWKNYDLSSSFFKNYQYILNKENYPHIHQQLLYVIKELEEKKPGYQISARGLLLSLYIEFYRIQSMDQPEANGGGITNMLNCDNHLAIAPALNYIEENYMQAFTIEHLADLCHLSSTHFRRIFHEIMGTSPLDFLNNTRIMKACNFLRSTEESILNISEMVGFRSVSSFNRYFIRIMQMSPREYRKQMIQTDTKSATPSILECTGWMYPE